MSAMRRVLVLGVALAAAAAPALASVEATPGVPALVTGGGTHVTLKGATKLTLNCDLRNYSTFTPAAGSAVIVNGYLSPSLLGVTNFADLTISKPGVVSLDNNAAVNGVLTLSNGRLSLAGHDLSANLIVGGSAASYVMTPDTLGRLVRTVGNASAVFFPVGHSAYNPVSVRTGSGTDVFRIAVLDAPPATGMTPSSALPRAWAVSHANAPGANGDVRWSVQWNGGESPVGFDRSIGGANSAWAWRWTGTTWTPMANVRRTDNGLYPAVDTLVSALPGLWTLGGLGSLLSAGGEASPRALELAPAWPNPFRGATNLRYGLPGKSRVTIGVYSVLGERVATLVDGEQEAGWHMARLEAGRLANGVYFLRVQAGAEVRSSKLVVMR